MAVCSASSCPSGGPCKGGPRREVDANGDELFAVSIGRSALDARRIKRGVGGHAWTDGIKLRVGIGTTQGGDLTETGYFGFAVHTVRRFERLPGGQS